MFDPISLAIYVGLTLVSQGLAARASRRKISDIQFPTDEPDRKIRYVAGTAEVSPHVIHWGDFKRSSINLDIPIGFGGIFGAVGVLALWLISKLPFGYRYYIGMALGLCLGPGVTIKEIKANDRTVWTGSVSGGSFTVSAPGEFGPEGGLFAVCDHVPGSMSQLRNTYLATQIANVPAFRGTSVIYWRGPSSAADAPTGDASALLNEVKYCGYIGRSTIVKELKVRLTRFPNNLGTIYSVVKTNHANFAEVINELLTNEIVGLGLPTSFIDTAVFAAVAETLYNEELGCSLKWEEPTEVNDIIIRLLETIDGVLYSSIDTGKITLKLNRLDYDPATLVSIDETQKGIELELEKSDPNNSLGEVRIPFVDVENNFLEGTALYQSISNRNAQGTKISVTLERLGLGDAAAANKVVTREGRALTGGPERGTLRANREQYAFTVGTAFKLSWAPYRLTEKIFRVLEVDHGTLEDEKIEFKIVEDRASASETAFGGNVSTLWSDPIVVNPTIGQTRRVVSVTTTAPPASPELGDRYWVPAGGTGAWSGLTGFASWDGTQWIFESADDSILNPFLNDADDLIYFWDGTTLRQAITTVYNTIQEEGVNVTRRETLNFIGPGVTAADDATNSRTNVTITEPLAARALEIAMHARAIAGAAAGSTDQTARDAAQRANELAAAALGIAQHARALAGSTSSSSATDVLQVQVFS